MKMKLLATAATVSLPLIFGGAYAQSTTAESGNNRASDGASASTNESTAGSSGSATSGSTMGGSSGGTTSSPGDAGTAGTGGTGGTGAAGSGASGAGTGASGAGTAGSGAMGAGSAGGSAGTGAAATGAAGTGATGAGTPTAPGMEAQGDAAASTEAITGWSAKDDIIGKTVVNENDEKIGDINDIVISSDGRSMYLLIGAGGFLGMGAKDVAVPFDRFERQDDRILLSGYTKEQLKALPEVRTGR